MNVNFFKAMRKTGCFLGFSMAEHNWHGSGLGKNRFVKCLRKARTKPAEGSLKVRNKRSLTCRRGDNLAATHRSLWLGSRPRPATGKFFCAMKKILVADDDASVRKMVARVLESAGYATILASDGIESVAKVRTAEPDLILLDIKMPGQSGWEAFGEISRMAALIPVIVITAWPGQYDQAARLGIDALMEKPLDLPLLLQTIDTLLGEPEQVRTKRLTDRNFMTKYLTRAGGNLPVRS